MCIDYWTQKILFKNLKLCLSEPQKQQELFMKLLLPPKFFLCLATIPCLVPFLPDPASFFSAMFHLLSCPSNQVYNLQKFLFRGDIKVKLLPPTAYTHLSPFPAPSLLLALSTSKWGLEISQNHNKSPSYRDQFLKGKLSLKEMVAM